MAPQIVLITGCSSGIGLAMVQRLTRDPDHRFIIIATVIAMSEKNDLEAAVKDYIDKVVFIKEMDVTKDGDITTVVESVINDHGQIDILLNIAGLSVVGIPENISREQVDQIFSVNVIGTIRLTQAVLPHMKEKQSGKIITFSSVAGRIGFAYLELYCASKFAVEGFFESLAAGIRAFNIRVCLVEPGPVKTGLWDFTAKQYTSHSNDDTIHAIDRRQLQNKVPRVSVEPVFEIDDVVNRVMSNCINADEPALRLLIADTPTDTNLAQIASDLTGEAGLQEFGLKELS
ncbi:retinol dehydrogenase 8-like [Lytechinus variegatus]|uniref:retinol dehydrogenase 8-like n=1 Tax=Lytechinus variegatus TaxID=7654 RepID=UPI001BB0F894|nr:retinol dehydrogenase 8-like [Lytechinus variegatus]